MDYLYLVSTPSVNVFGVATTTQSIASSYTAHEARNHGVDGELIQKGCKEMCPLGNKVGRKSLKRKTRRKVKQNVSSSYDTPAVSSVLEARLEEHNGSSVVETSPIECSKTEEIDMVVKAVGFHKSQKKSKSRDQLAAATLPCVARKRLTSTTKTGTTATMIASLRHQTGKENIYAVWKKVERNGLEVSGSGARMIGLSWEDDDNVVASFESNRVGVPKVSKPGSKAPKMLKRKILHLKRDVCNSNCRGLKASCPHKFNINSHNMVKCVPRLSYKKNSYPTSRFQVLELEHVDSEPNNDHGTVVAVDDASHLAKTSHDHEHSTVETFAESQDASLMEFCNPVHSPQALPGNKACQATKEVETGEFNKQSHGSILQKWIPIGVKEPELTSSDRLEKMTIATNSPNQISEQADDDDDDVSNRVQYDKNTCNNSDDSRSKQVNQGTTVVANTCRVISSRPQELTSSDTVVGLEGILKAVHNTFEMQLASEAIEVATGCPIAEFERLLHSSSPSCQTNSLDQACQAPNIPLQSLWQWYERHGICGLEVRAEDHRKSNRLSIDQPSFRAYFVPFLSAVQLFKKNEEKADAQNNGSADKAWTNDVELLFEYFELERPQLRQPLYEKIHELARGDDLPAARNMFGNPSALVSMNLPELHNKSWYSVAWYPIYKIPDGNLRAAFLTYHSFGHVVERRTQFGSPTTMVCPVVGLQSYNAQDECWFQPRHSAMDHQTGGGMLEPGQVLKERLRTLQETASCMARASVKKGEESSVKNWHPDYEFFLSRQLY